MLAILDYKAGNQTSVRRALDFLGVECAITDDPKVVESADGIIFPGVGAAGQAMKELKSRGLDEVLKAMVWAEKPVLGICIGCQVLLDYTQENDTVTLGLIPGECVLFTPGLTDDDGQPVKVPHMGWNRVKLVKDCALFKDVDPASEFYFVHSFHPKPAPEFVVGVTSYGEEFCSVHGRDGLWATQFHPEKSGRPGLKILQNFHDYCMERRRAV